MELKAGEKQNITFSLKPDDFALYDDNAQRIIEPGDFTVMVGGSSASGIKAIVNAKEKIVVN